LIGALAVMIAVPACSSDGGPAKVSAADAYVAAIRWYLEENPPLPPTTDGQEAKALTVYIAPADGNAIAVGEQADVIAELQDMQDQVVVNFVDVKDDAIQDEDEIKPVKGDGVLLLVGTVVEAPPPVEVQIGVYHDVENELDYVMRIVKKGSAEFDVTAVTELEQS
jgi:hypothetical protein